MIWSRQESCENLTDGVMYFRIYNIISRYNNCQKKSTKNPSTLKLMLPCMSQGAAMMNASRIRLMWTLCLCSKFCIVIPRQRWKKPYSILGTLNSLLTAVIYSYIWTGLDYVSKTYRDNRISTCVISTHFKLKEDWTKHSKVIIGHTYVSQIYTLKDDICFHHSRNVTLVCTLPQSLLTSPFLCVPRQTPPPFSLTSTLPQLACLLDCTIPFRR